jgi:hypothetical protein
LPVVRFLPKLAPQQAQLVPGGPVLAGLAVVPGVGETVHGEGKLRGVEREGLEQAAELRKAGQGDLGDSRLPQQTVEAITEKAAGGCNVRVRFLSRHAR